MKKRKSAGIGDNSVAEEMLLDGDPTPPDALVFDVDGNLIKQTTEFVALKRSKKGSK